VIEKTQLSKERIPFSLLELGKTYSALVGIMEEASEMYGMLQKPCAVSLFRRLQVSFAVLHNCQFVWYNDEH
jgi:hypothetical protein